MNKAVVVERLIKDFNVNLKSEGLKGSLLSLVKPQKKHVHALKGISFNIDEGELVGFIGPNGAGKTTTLKLLSGLLYPSSGFIQVLGYDPWERKSEYLKKISLVMGQKNQLWWDLPAMDTFELNKAIYEISDKSYKAVLTDLISLLGVENLLSTPVRKLSLGQRMRLELIAALLHQPKVLFLDEPTIGLDVLGQQRIREFIADYNRRYSASVVLTSHNMDDLIDLAKRVIVINKGEIVFDGNFRDLILSFARNKLMKVSFSREIDIKQLESVGKVISIEFPLAVISVKRQAVALAAAELLQNFPVADLTIEEENIENVIRRVFKGEIVKKVSKLKKT